MGSWFEGGWALGGFLGTGGNSKFVKAHGGKQRGRLEPDAALPLRSQSTYSGMCDAAERQRLREEAELSEEKASMLASDPKEMAKYLLDQAESAQSFGFWFNKRFKELGLTFPTVTVTYRDLNIVAEAAVGKAQIPTLESFFLPCAGTCARNGGGSPLATVVNKASGVLKPGRLTLLLGPPGAGKSVLLRQLSGQLAPSPTLEVTGTVRYNGRDASTFDLQRTAAYVDQYDVHLPLLTVHETLLFARKCQWASGCKNALEEETTKLLADEVKTAACSEKKATLVRHGPDMAAMLAEDDFHVETTLALLGLEHCRDTIVGDAMTRGISGGERRRLTSGEILVGDREFICMDEISTGLDSATTANVVQYLGYFAHAFETTMLVSLLQPSNEVVQLFDDIILLAEGRVLFHGPVDAALPHFLTLGFACPPRKEPPSFLQEITFPNGQAELSTPELRQSAQAPPGGGLLVSLDTMADAYWASETGAAMKKDRDEAEDMEYTGSKVLVENTDQSPWMEYFRICLARQVKLLWRDVELLQGRLLQVALLSVIIGTLFVRMTPSSSTTFQFMAAAFMSLAVMIFITMPLMAGVFAQKPVFTKQKLYMFYPPSSYGLSLCLVEIPITVVCGLLMTVLVYWLCNFDPSPGRFFMFLLQLCLGSLTFGSLFIFLAAATPNMTVAGGLGAMIELSVILLSGFPIIRPMIGWWWRWLYYANPMSWIFRSLCTDEFTSSRWASPDIATPTGPLGDVVLSSWGMWSNYDWVWSSVLFCLGFYGIMLILICIAFALTKPPPKKANLPAGPKEDKEESEDGKVSRAASASSANKDVEANAKGGAATLDIDFCPITLIFRNIDYYVPKPSWSNAPESESHPGCIQLLKTVSGIVKPGQLICLMGASGAGKTTLMDVVAGRKTQGTIEGDVLLNGHPKEQSVWRRVSAYVEQTDILHFTATVWETLLFSARLRLPSSIDDGQVKSLCASVMRMVELEPLRDSLVGEPGHTGLALEARKRLSIATELVANPSVIFMDEPTSGLDAAAASVVMRVARSIASSQRTIMSTIHQPSAEIFLAFDSVLLLQRGGRTIYCGPLGVDSTDLLAYLTGLNVGVREIVAGENSANYMMEITADKAPDGQDFADLWNASKQRAAVDEDITVSEEQGAAGPPPTATGTMPGEVSGEYATPRATQLRMLLWRHVLHYWRLPDYNGIRLLLTFCFAVFLGTLFFNRGQLKGDVVNLADLLGVLNCFFMSLSNLGAVNLLSIIDVVAQERAVLYRERAAGQYSAAMYVWSGFIVELPYLVVQVIVFAPISYFLVRFSISAGSFFFYCLVFLLSLVLYTSFGQAVLYLSPNVQAAQSLGATTLVVIDIFKGFVLPRNEMGWWWRWVWYLNPSSWMAFALSANQLGNSNVRLVDEATGVDTTVSVFLDSQYGFKSSWQWWSVLIVVGMVVFFRIVAVFAVQLLNHQKR